MKVVESPYEAFAQVDHWRQQGESIGFVPTMGALHEGHFSLVRQSRQQCQRSVTSIFVNPTQFAPSEDLERYPRTLEADLGGLRELGVDLVFVPQPEHLYPSGFSTYVEPPACAERLEGQHRPGHFRGVATIVLKLFQIIPATVAFFGQKDYQQLAVIRSMVEDLNVPIRVVGCETIREKDGLAMSSRNRYLSDSERTRALCLSRALSKVEELISGGERDASRLELAMKDILVPDVDSIDYARVVDAASLEDLECIDSEAVALIAAFVGKTRLIDNRVLSVSKKRNDRS